MSRETKEIEAHIDELMRRIGELEQERDTQLRDAGAQAQAWVVILGCLLFIVLALLAVAKMVFS